MGVSVPVGVGLGVSVGVGVNASAKKVTLQLAEGSTGNVPCAPGSDSGTEGATGLVPISRILIAVKTATTAKIMVAKIIPIIVNFFFIISK